MRDVAVTGLGAVSCLGHGVAALVDGLRRGVDGIRPLRRFDLEGYATDLAGVVPDANAPGPDPYALCVDFAEEAILEAVRHAGLPPGAMDGDRAALVLGLSPIGGDTLVHELAEDIRARLGWRCATLTTSTACCSSTAAIGFGGALLDLGRFDVVVAGGAEAIVPGLFAGFHALGALTTGRCSPFSETLGTTVGEGAGFVVLQRSATRPLAWLQGSGLSNDAWHETSPDPSGAGLALALASALDDAGARGVDYVNAHGTGTAANDIAEVTALRALLGDDLPPISSTKGHLGHAQAAAGSLELLATLACAEEGTLPPTLRASPKRARMPPDCVEGDRPRHGHWSRFAKNSAAFGGANACLVVGREPGPSIGERPLWVEGIAAVGRHGATVPELARAWETGERGPASPVIPDIRRVDTAGLDPAARLATAAAAAALEDAGARVGRRAEDTIGVVGGTVCASPTEKRRLDDGIDARGLMHLPVGAFARLVLNASTAAAARALRLRGPHTAVSTGHGSGLAALVASAVLLGRDRRASRLVALGVHEPPEPEAGRGYGAAAVVLSAARSGVRLASWSLRATPEAAEAEALSLASLRGADLRFGPESADRLGLAPGYGELAQVVLAVAALRAGSARHAVVTAAGTAAMSVVLWREEA